MQCPKCAYEPTMAEIQGSSENCPKCGWAYAEKYTIPRHSEPAEARPARVVVTDIELPFGSAVRLMVTLALASIPAAIVVTLIFVGVPSFFRAIF